MSKNAGLLQSRNARKMVSRAFGTKIAQEGKEKHERMLPGEAGLKQIEQAL